MPYKLKIVAFSLKLYTFCRWALLNGVISTALGKHVCSSGYREATAIKLSRRLIPRNASVKCAFPKVRAIKRYPTHSWAHPSWLVLPKKHT